MSHPTARATWGAGLRRGRWAVRWPQAGTLGTTTPARVARIVGTGTDSSLLVNQAELIVEEVEAETAIAGRPAAGGHDAELGPEKDIGGSRRRDADDHHVP